MFSLFCALVILRSSSVASKHIFYNFSVFWILVGFQLRMYSNLVFFLLRSKEALQDEAKITKLLGCH